MVIFSTKFELFKFLGSDRIPDRFYVISMEFLSLSRRPARNVPSGEERGETDVFAGYVIDCHALYFQQFMFIEQKSHVELFRNGSVQGLYRLKALITLRKVITSVS